MRTFFAKLIPQMGKNPCGNVTSILTKLQKIFSFVKTVFSDAGLYQMASSALLHCLSLLQHVLGPSVTQGPTKVNTHVQASLTERVCKLKNVLEEMVSSQFYREKQRLSCQRKYRKSEAGSGLKHTFPKCQCSSFYHKEKFLSCRHTVRDAYPDTQTLFINSTNL